MESFLEKKVSVQWVISTTLDEAGLHKGISINISVFGRTIDSSAVPSDTPDSLLTLDLTSVHSLQRIDAMTSVVVALNEARLQSRRPNIIPAFSDSLLKFGQDSRSIQLADVLKVISAQISDEDEEQLEAVAPRAFRKDYIERKGLDKMHAKITEGSRRFLQGLAWGVIVAEVSQHPQEAQLGGIPSVVQRVRGFLNIRFKEAGKWNSDLTVTSQWKFKTKHRLSTTRLYGH